MKKKFILFMMGMRNLGQAVGGECKRGEYRRTDAQISFAVPSLSVLKSYHEDLFPNKIDSGIIGSTIDLMSSHTDKYFIIYAWCRCGTIHMLSKFHSSTAQPLLFRGCRR